MPFNELARILQNWLIWSSNPVLKLCYGYGRDRDSRSSSLRCKQYGFFICCVYVLRYIYLKLSLFSQSCFQLAREFSELRVCLVVGLRQALVGASSSPGQGLPTTALKPIEVFTKHIKLYGKMFRRMQRLFSRRFIGLPGANEFVLYCWTEVVKAASGPSDLIEGIFRLYITHMT